jgi:exodeoxyribonuclease-3
MKIASWNINSVRLRMPLVQRLVAEHPVDVLCLQETKVKDDLFPHAELQMLGFEHVIFAGEKSYNGVAILSKQPLERIDAQDFGGAGQARHVAARLEDGTALHNLYIPAGGDEPDPTINPKFAHKLQFLEDLTAWSAARDKPSPAIILGDFNIAPLEHDVWSRKQLRRVVSHTDIEREKLGQLQQAGGWVDSHRALIPAEEKLYSWWSYRARDWQASNRGRRLDHIWLSPGLRDRLQHVHSISEARGWEKPSDHIPIVTQLA